MFPKAAIRVLSFNVMPWPFPFACISCLATGSGKPNSWKRWLHCTVTCASSTSFLWCVRVCVCVKIFTRSPFVVLAWVASDIEEVDELEEELSSSTFSPLAFACFLIFFCNFFLATLETDTIKSNHCHHCHGIARPNNELEWRENWLIAKDWPRIFLFSSSFKNFFFSLDSFFIRFTSSIIALASFTKS